MFVTTMILTAWHDEFDKSIIIIMKQNNKLCTYYNDLNLSYGR